MDNATLSALLPRIMLALLPSPESVGVRDPGRMVWIPDALWNRIRAYLPSEETEP